jgi:hypothetical protein
MGGIGILMNNATVFSNPYFGQQLAALLSPGDQKWLEMVCHRFGGRVGF